MTALIFQSHVKIVEAHGKPEDYTLVKSDCKLYLPRQLNGRQMEGPMTLLN